MISKDMLELLFRSASMQRWNDHIRPHTGFRELATKWEFKIIHHFNKFIWGGANQSKYGQLNGLSGGAK